MKLVAAFLILITVFSCNKTPNEVKAQQNVTINNVEVLKKHLNLNQNTGVWYYNKKPFSGYSVKYHNNNQLEEKVGFYNGKRYGIARNWFLNGNLRYEYYFKKNRLDTIYKSWWQNGNQSGEKFYNNGIQNGIEKKWYSSGKLAKLRNIKNNREEGLQQAWLENGKLYVNYEAKNGRIFGLKRANLCYKLKKEEIQYAEKN